MRKKIAIALVAVIVLSGLGVGLYFILRPVPLGGPDVKLNTPYYFKELRHGLYRYPQTTGAIGMPKPGDANIIELQDDDISYCEFTNGWKNFHVVFEHGVENRTDMIFIVAKIKRGGGALEATIKHIYAGKLREYKVTTTRERIIVKSTVMYKVAVASEEYKPNPIIDVFRDSAIVMSFLRHAS